jgi:signal transduction histidine kinase
MRTQSFDRNDHLTEWAWRAARGLWVLLAVLMVGILALFVFYDLHRLLVDPCPVLGPCVLNSNWLTPPGMPRWLFASLHLAVLIVPAVIWMSLAVWVFVSRPRWIWGYVFSLFYLMGWFSETNIQPIHELLREAIPLLFLTLGFSDLARSLEVQAWVDLVRGVLKMLADVLLVLAVFTFPNGRFWPQWSKYFLWAFVAVAFFYSIPPFRYSNLNYTRWPNHLGEAFFLVLTLGLLAAIVQRFRISDPQTRVRLNDVLPSHLASVGWYIIASIYDYALEEMLFPVQSTYHLIPLQSFLTLLRKSVNAVLMVWFAASVARAIARHQLFDIRFVLNRTLAFGALTLSALSIYALIVGGFGSLFRNGELWLSVLATGVIAVLFQPLLIIFRRAANRLIYGERDDPYRAIANLGRRLEAALPPDEMLSTVVQTVAGSLKLPFVALRLQDGRVVSVGIPLATPVEFALLVNGIRVGQLEVSPRHANEVFALSERRLLSDLANRAAVAVQEVQLLDALRQSREALVLAREEERKRLRRDLHDGLGPTLVGVSFSLEASRMLLDSDRSHDRSHDRARADALLASSGLRIEEAIADIRRLVDDLRPPALDDLGLCGAIQQRADQFVSLRPILEFESLPALPAAVEVAAFRITCEALNNAIKHARASSVRVQVRIVDHGLDLQVSDDGVGLSEHRREGVGLQTMRERALELGGRFEVKSLGDGTRVSAWLPVRAQ